MENADREVLDHFGREWAKFDHEDLDRSDLEQWFEMFFHAFPWDRVPATATGLDVGCGGGRWARFVAPRVGTLHCIEPSDAVDVAARHLAGHDNVVLHRATMSAIPLPEAMADFAYCLGVLHVVPDPGEALAASARHLKPGAPYLVYAPYALDNRPRWYRWAWRASDVVRRLVSALPHPVRRGFADVVAVAVYLPLARLAALAERLGMHVDRFPLAAYRHRSLYIMRTDALDRFGTRRERRFTATEVRRLMEDAGLAGVEISPHVPHWTAVGFKAPR